MKIANVVLPKYSKGEEIFNAVTHGIGIIFAMVATVLGVVFAVKYSNRIAVVAMSIYGGSMILLFSMSTLYHALQGKSKKLFRLFDHCSIFLLIAGTYTPYTLVTLNGSLGWVIFGIVWGIATLGITINIIDIKKFSKLSMLCYLLSGWIIIFFFPSLVNFLGQTGIILLLLGGVAYTVGAIVYGIGKKHPYFHSVWHLFIILGSVLQYFSILLYVLK